MKRALYLMIILTYSAQSRAQELLTLKDCIEIGVGNNLTLRRTEEDIRKAKLGISESRAKLLPVINAFGNFNNNVDANTTLLDGSASGVPYIESHTLRYSTSAGAQLSLPLYNQTLYTSMKIAGRMKEISQYSYDKAKADLTIEISRLYYLAQTTSEQIKLTKDNIDRLTKLKNITEAFHDNDMALGVDVKRVSINLENMQVQYDNAVAIFEQQMNLLKYILDLDADMQISLTPFDPANPDLVQTTGLSPDLNEFKILYAQKDLLHRQKHLVNQGYIPTLSLVGKLSYTNFTDHFTNYFHANQVDQANRWYNNFLWGLSINLPIFDGFEKKLKSNKAQISILQNELQITDTQKKLEIEYVNDINDWENNKRTYKRQMDNYQLSIDVYDVTADQYKEGVSSMSDLLQDEMRMSNAQNNYLNAYYTCKVSELKLLKLTNQLDVLSK